MKEIVYLGSPLTRDVAGNRVIGALYAFIFIRRLVVHRGLLVSFHRGDKNELYAVCVV